MDNEQNQPTKEEVDIAIEEKPTEKEWQEYKTEIENLREQVYQKAKQVLGDDDGNDWAHFKIYDFAQEVSDNMPNSRDFIALHRLIYSSTNLAKAPFLDMPSPYNVKDFCNELLRELDDKENCQEYLHEKGPNRKS